MAKNDNNSDNIDSAAIEALVAEIPDTSVKRLIRSYMRGDFEAPHIQSALRLILGTATPEAGAIRHLLAVTQDADLKTQLQSYTSGDPIPSDEKFIVLNSFPKSGNTWLRSFLSHLCFDGSLENIPDHYSSDIWKAPTYRLPDGTVVRFYKSHDKTLHETFRRVSISHAAAIYIRRHPLDVFLSHLNFMHLPTDPSRLLRPRKSLFATDFRSIDEIIEKKMMGPFLGAFTVYGTMNPQFSSVGSWYEHAEYWSGELAEHCPVFRYSYENLSAKKVECLLELGSFLGKSDDETKTAFQAAQASTAKDGAFFWKQRPGQYKEMLDSEDVAEYQKRFVDKLKIYGY